MRMYILSSSSVFLSTPSARRATYILSDVGCIGLDFYPRPPRGGRLLAMLDKIYHAVISIHALREEGDKRRGHIHG